MPLTRSRNFRSHGRLSPEDGDLWMRKVRDFDAELKVLEERAKLLKERKIQQFGELVEATGADRVDPNCLAGALLAAVSERDAATISSWTSRGERFFREGGRNRTRSIPAERCWSRNRRRSATRFSGGGDGSRANDNECRAAARHGTDRVAWCTGGTAGRCDQRAVAGS